MRSSDNFVCRFGIIPFSCTLRDDSSSCCASTFNTSIPLEEYAINNQTELNTIPLEGDSINNHIYNSRKQIEDLCANFCKVLINNKV